MFNFPRVVYTGCGECRGVLSKMCAPCQVCEFFFSPFIRKKTTVPGKGARSVKPYTTQITE